MTIDPAFLVDLSSASNVGFLHLELGGTLCTMNEICHSCAECNDVHDLCQGIYWKWSDPFTSYLLWREAVWSGAIVMQLQVACRETCNSMCTGMRDCVLLDAWQSRPSDKDQKNTNNSP